MPCSDALQRKVISICPRTSLPGEYRFGYLGDSASLLGKVCFSYTCWVPHGSTTSAFECSPCNKYGIHLDRDHTFLPPTHQQLTQELPAAWTTPAYACPACSTNQFASGHLRCFSVHCGWTVGCALAKNSVPLTQWCACNKHCWLLFQYPQDGRTMALI